MCQTRTHQINTSKISLTEVGPAEIGPEEVGPADVGPDEVAPAEVGLDVGLLLAPSIPGLRPLPEDGELFLVGHARAPSDA